MVHPKKKSKRTCVRLKHKIEKRSTEKGRKERKHIKKNPHLYPKKKNETALGIPNSYPYKDQILAEIEEARRLKIEQAAAKKEEAKKRRQEAAAAGQMELSEEEEESEEEDSDDDMDEGSDSEEQQLGGNSAMAALLASARARAEEFEEEHGDNDNDHLEEGSDSEVEHDQTAPGYKKESSRRAFDKVFKQVVDAADVVLYVLDARDPEGTRSKEVERAIMAAEGGEKRLILVLNKIDLIPPAVLKGWLTYLRRYFPTIPLKASNGAPNAQSFDHKSLTVAGTSATLLKALKSFAQSKKLMRSVTVGVIGYPNVGKSSVINALTGRLGGSQHACPTGAEAGVTTSLREVKLDKKLKLLDSPGIVFPKAKGESKASKAEAHARLVLLHAIPPKQIVDPIPAVTLLLQRFSTSQVLLDKLFDVYKLPPFVNTGIDTLTKNFLIEVARKRGRLGKGGVPNLESAAVAVIMDWRDGRIQGWIDPPVSMGTKNASLGIKSETVISAEPDQKEVVKEWMTEFSLEGFNDEQDEEVPEIEMQD